ncbi:hypothetical protein AMTR_s00034p00187880 [Amborella trichopoda]|uniref:Uncharacterized protein n=1 Tax=Amborella trichopoda TaxID=13333 RepID=W1PQB6_AMBTC|nr:hypothetical protein AMTR_s00034p00187880 [Amborella trichopoda]
MYRVERSSRASFYPDHREHAVERIAACIPLSVPLTHATKHVSPSKCCRANFFVVRVSTPSLTHAAKRVPSSKCCRAYSIVVCILTPSLSCTNAIVEHALAA